MNRIYRQITTKRSVIGDNFDKGVIDVDFSIGGKTVWIPSLSYFRIGMKLTKADGTSPILKSDDVTFANHAAGNLFDNVYFMAGGQTVSSIVNYAPQAGIAEYRLSKSGAWLNSVGKDAYGVCSDFEYRQMKTAVQDDADDVLVPVAQDVSQQNDVYFMYKPPIGIMSHNKPMASGDFRFQFNPNSNYKHACVQSKFAAKTPGTDYVLQITSMELYICTEMMDVSPSGVTQLKLTEHQVQSKPLQGVGDSNFDFTIQPSTKAISVFVQSGAAGSNTLCPPSLFAAATSVGDDTFYAQNSLRSLQLSYASITKPPTRWTSEFSETQRKMQQRYLDTQIESGQAFSSGGCETLQQWLDGGVLLHYSWVRDASDRATQLQLQCDFSNVEPGSNLFVVSHYTKEVDISTDQGYVTGVQARTI